MTALSLTGKLAEFAVSSQFDHLPHDVVRAARRAMLDSIGVMAAGVRHPASRTVVEMVAALGGGGKCKLVGSSHRTDPVNAALANGTTAHVLDWDDTILPTRAHLSAALLPPLMAVGELEGWTFDDIVPAFAIGFELAARLNLAIYPRVHLRGWQGTGIVGGIGAAAALGRMIGLTGAQVGHAFGIAATDGSGLIATFGSMAKSINIGRAGASGLQSAYLAARGFTSHRDILGAGKYLEMFDEAPRHEVLLEGLGERWSILENGYKLYPCGFVAHATIDAVRDLRKTVGARDDLKRLVLRVSPESMQLMGNKDPSTELEAKFSLVYDAAVAWITGDVTPGAFEDHAVRDPRYRTIMELTEIVVSPDVSQEEAHAEATFGDGSVDTIHVLHARGTTSRPLDDNDLREKFMAGMALGGFTHGNEIAELLGTSGTQVREVLKFL